MLFKLKIFFITFFRTIKILPRRIKKIISWLPILWHDQNWDYRYLFIVMRKKIGDMERHFESDKTNIAEADKVAKELRVARILLDRLCNDDYLNNALHWYEKKYGNNSNDILNFIFKDINNKQRKMFSKWANHSDYMKDQDIDYLFNLMKKKIQWWWD